MSDSDQTTQTNFTQNRNVGSSQKLKDQMVAAGSEMKERAATALQASSDVARDTFQEATDAVKDMASSTVDQIQGQAREQQRSGADFVERLAGNIREAARAFESDVPFAARGINSAADYVEDAAEEIRNGSFRGLVDDATGFAKRQPVAFLGISVLAGFAAVRFLRASGDQSSSSRSRGTGNTLSSERGGVLCGSSSAAGEPRRQASSPLGVTRRQTSSSQSSAVS
jgi:hypothetical protein